MSKKTGLYANEAATEELIRIGKLPEALRLAEGLEKTMQWPLHGKAADELRRLHALNQELLAALRGALEHWPVPSSICKDRPAYEAARAAIAKATVVAA